MGLLIPAQDSIDRAQLEPMEVTADLRNTNKLVLCYNVFDRDLRRVNRATLVQTRQTSRFAVI